MFICSCHYLEMFARRNIPTSNTIMTVTVCRNEAILKVIISVCIAFFPERAASQEEPNQRIDTQIPPPSLDGGSFAKAREYSVWKGGKDSSPFHILLSSSSSSDPPSKLPGEVDSPPSPISRLANIFFPFPARGKGNMGTRVSSPKILRREDD